MTERDGSRDFDPLLGNWNFHLRRLIHPLTGSNDWIEYEGESHCISIWGGRGQLDELSIVNRTDGSRIEGLTVRLYSPKTREWLLYWASATNPSFDPPQKGKFANGHGEFLEHDTINGKRVLVRYLWFDLNTNTPRFEQSFSTDDGKTWEANWITFQTRKSDAHGKL